MLDTFVDALREQIATPKADLEKNIRALLNEMVSKMDLVSQQELDRQKIALEQANLRLSALQQQLDQLEDRIKQL
ncbi:MAG: accessory factor UbiK family protein [Acinetobacter populi]|uniref:accessory factor UbiK family protein n=1 Tax=Acinetobacter populi TaxID=1582270 RepID=UPI002356B57D|nr:accessory factor UbiK family protein [Acinetobacter populi]MCH4249018.1 accessory factor UbiK family protein [Acinetobacter populi]